ncbi:MAG: flagellar hook-basal body complex protein FliE [Eubacteriales bacterium]|nr:flagellar hook-basal body complex protein FliE [Eubacteriales bacterium]
MVQALSSVSALQSAAAPSIERAQAPASDFSSWMDQALQPAREAQAQAQAESLGLLTGQATSVHQVVLAAEKADLALQLTVQIRNKALDAYNEIMRMQL